METVGGERWGSERHVEPRHLSVRDLLRIEELENDLVAQLRITLAHLAPHAIARARLMALAAPEYDHAIVHLTGAAVDDLTRPLFDEAGIADRFVPQIRAEGAAA